MKIVLFQPEIPPNTGNIARMCAAFGIALNLVEPLGFSLDDRRLKRAGLDYWPHVQLSVWPDFSSFRSSLSPDERLIAASTRGNLRLEEFCFSASDCLVFGPETRGLPSPVLEAANSIVRIPFIPMDKGGVRSLNLATAAGIFCCKAMSDAGLLHSIP